MSPNQAHFMHARVSMSSGWLQFERLCELVLEADAGVDPTRWEGSADQLREVVVRGRAARSAGGRSRRRC